MTETKHTRKELYDAANMLRENCDKAKSCLDCDFFKNSCGGCALSQTPAGWRALHESRWSAADILMAKALKAYGYTHIRRNEEQDYKRIYGLIIKNGVKLRIAEILREGFANAEPYKVYNLDDIIAAGAAENDVTDSATDGDPAQSAPTLTAQQLDLSDIEIQLLKLCKLLGYDSIAKCANFGHKFTIVGGSEKYRVWRLPDSWNDEDELFPKIIVGESIKIDDLLAQYKS